jgi:hypothetical protein
MEMWWMASVSWAVCPSFPAPAPIALSLPRPESAPDQVTLVLVARDEERQPIPGVVLEVRAESLPEPVLIASDAEGMARVTALPVSTLVIGEPGGRSITLEGVRAGLTRFAWDTDDPVAHPPQPGSGALAEELLLVYERSSCLGPCPVFTVTVSREGRLRWEGADHAQAEGTRERQLAARRLLRIEPLLACAQQMPVFDRYSRTDFPTTSLIFQRDGSSWSWTWYGGDTRAPQARLLRYRRRLERALGVRRWVGD